MSDTNINSKIQKIYITRGDNIYTSDGVKSDKMIGLVINDKIHWLDIDFAYMDDLALALEGWFNIHMASNGQWGVMDEEGRATLDQKITRISKHHDDIFNNESYYMKRTMAHESGRTWWSCADIVETYLNKEVETTAS